MFILSYLVVASNTASAVTLGHILLVWHARTDLGYYGYVCYSLN